MYCKDECVAWYQAVERTNRVKILNQLSMISDELEAERLKRYLVKIEMGATVIKCCDTIMLLSQGEIIQYGRPDC
jgi:ABC-type branched-subunit amino acid transport system ATPase component